MARRTEADSDNWPVLEENTLVGGAAPPPAGYYPPPAPPPDRRLGMGMLLGILTVLLVAAGIALAWFLTHRDSKNHVTTVLVSTPPPASTQAQATTPTKARAVRKAAVPTVIGMPISDAKAVFDKLGLRTTVTQVTSNRRPGTVVDQAPEPGAKLAKGSYVTLSVVRATSTGATTTTAATSTAPAATTTAPAPAPQPTAATMPDVTNQTEAAAAQSMSSAGLLPSIFFVPGSDPLGTVEQQAKAAGTKLAYHAHVQINVSSGPGDKPKETVPNVIGKTLQDAVSSLNGAHLRLIFVKLPVTVRTQAGKVVQQSPLGGNQAPQNAQVLVFLGALKG
jgi:serine/threonine-protein kinase